MPIEMCYYKFNVWLWDFYGNLFTINENIAIWTKIDVI